MTNYDKALTAAEEKLKELSSEVEKDVLDLVKIESIKADFTKKVSKVIDHVEDPDANVSDEVSKRTWVAVLTYTDLRKEIFNKTQPL
jgi:hypothetical protein